MIWPKQFFHRTYLPLSCQQQNNHSSQNLHHPVKLSCNSKSEDPESSNYATHINIYIQPPYSLYQDDEEFDVKSANNSPMRIFVREILDNAPMDLEMGLVTRHKVSTSVWRRWHYDSHRSTDLSYMNYLRFLYLIFLDSFEWEYQTSKKVFFKKKTIFSILALFWSEWFFFLQEESVFRIKIWIYFFTKYYL